MTKHRTLTFRYDELESEFIDDVRELMQGKTGIAVSKTDIIRLALNNLEQYLVRTGDVRETKISMRLNKQKP